MARRSIPKNFIAGVFESVESSTINTGNSHRFISVGYSTNSSLNAYCPTYTDGIILPLASRKYVASLVCQSDSRPEYKYRQHLLDYANIHGLPSDMFIHSILSYRERKHYEVIHNITSDPSNDINPSRVDGNYYQSNSIMTLSLPGDTPTTDRMFSAFVTHTLIGVLSHTKTELIAVLPFTNRVPWEKLFVWIDTDEFMIDPIQAIRDSLARIDIKEQLRLMQQYRREVIWMEDGSRVLQNVLETAVSRVGANNL
jgi:hypothetical protein